MLKKITEISSGIENGSKMEQVEKKIELSLKLFNTMDLKDLKEVSVSVIPNTTLVPLRNEIGLKLYSDGVLTVGMNQIEGKKPYANAGLTEGDRIISIDNKEISNTEDLVQNINNSK